MGNSLLGTLCLHYRKQPVLSLLSFRVVTGSVIAVHVFCFLLTCLRVPNTKATSMLCRCCPSHKQLAARATLTIDPQEAQTRGKLSDQALHLAFPNGRTRDLGRPLAGFDSIEDALQDFAKGRLVIVLDNEERENEGDLIMAADKVLTPSLCFH